MKLPIYLVISLYLIAATAIAGNDDRPRFSTGLIHSGELEIEFDLAGASRFSIGISGEPTKFEWIDATLVGGSGTTTPLEGLHPLPTAKRTDYDIRGKGITRFTARLRIDHDGDKTSRIEFYHDAPRADPGKEIRSLTGDPRQGRNVFGRGTCSSCHVLDGRGGRVGPDLSALGDRAELSAIIESLIVPDADLAQGFETNIITTKDGTPHLGFVVGDESKLVSIRDSAGQTHEIDKEEIVSRRPQNFSLMPPFGELLSPQQLADLAAFLKAQRK
jgi:putative heme-binding domain-containing protein